jgi:hypothetical protein
VSWASMFNRFSVGFWLTGIDWYYWYSILHP